MDISESKRDGVHIFTIGGRIDALGVDDVDHALQGAVSAGERNIVLDMSDVSFINSAGSRALATTRTRLRARGGDLKLAALSYQVLRVFQLVGLNRIFPPYETVDMALAGF